MFDLLSASMVAVSSEMRSGFNANPPENRTRVLRPGTVRSNLATARMESSMLRAAKPDSAPPSDGAPMAASCVPPPELTLTAEYLMLLTARFSNSPSAVKFCAILTAPL